MTIVGFWAKILARVLVVLSSGSLSQTTPSFSGFIIFLFVGRNMLGTPTNPSYWVMQSDITLCGSSHIFTVTHPHSQLHSHQPVPFSLHFRRPSASSQTQKESVVGLPRLLAWYIVCVRDFCLTLVCVLKVLSVFVCVFYHAPPLLKSILFFNSCLCFLSFTFACVKQASMMSFPVGVDSVCAGVLFQKINWWHWCKSVIMSSRHWLNTLQSKSLTITHRRGVKPASIKNHSAFNKLKCNLPSNSDGCFYHLCFFSLYFRLTFCHPGFRFSLNKSSPPTSHNSPALMTFTPHDSRKST